MLNSRFSVLLFFSLYFLWNDVEFGVRTNTVDSLERLVLYAGITFCAKISPLQCIITIDCFVLR